MSSIPSSVAAVIAGVALATAAWADVPKGGKINAKEEFEKHCIACHPNGGNVMKPDKTLRKKDMQAHGIRTPQDIVKVMRKPGPGMTAFDRQAVDDSTAKAIAEYILKTFK